jgi:hypothetical protein
MRNIREVESGLLPGLAEVTFDLFLEKLPKQFKFCWD